MTSEIRNTDAEVQTPPRYTPATDILEMEDGFHILMDMPGVGKDGLTIDLQESDVTVRAVSAYSRDPKRIVHAEFGPAEYVRTFSLSDAVDRDRIKATLKDGVLNLHLPKADKAKPRRIEIQPA